MDNGTTTGGSYQKLSDQEIKHQVKNLEVWKVVNGKLNRTFDKSGYGG